LESRLFLFDHGATPGTLLERTTVASVGLLTSTETVAHKWLEGLAQKASEVYIFDVKAPRLLLSNYTREGAFTASLTVLSGELGHTITPHSHDFWESFLILSGSGLHQVNGHEYPLEPGQVWLVRPRDTHSLRPHPVASLRFINVAFSSSVWLGFLEFIGLSEQALCWQSAQRPPMVRVVGMDYEQAQALYQTTIQESLKASSKLPLVRFWTWLVPWLEQSESNGLRQAPAWLAVMLRALDDPQTLHPVLAEIVAQLGLSHAHVSRTFKAYLGQTPTAYINERRMLRASRLLATTDTEILDIALDCGFDNLSYFYRRFRRRFALTPSRYRRNARRPIAP